MLPARKLVLWRRGAVDAVRGDGTYNVRYDDNERVSRLVDLVWSTYELLVQEGEPLLSGCQQKPRKLRASSWKRRMDIIVEEDGGCRGTPGS